MNDAVVLLVQVSTVILMMAFPPSVHSPLLSVLPKSHSVWWGKNGLNPFRPYLGGHLDFRTFPEFSLCSIHV